MPAAQPTILSLPFRQPFSFRQVTGFLKPRAIPGVEFVEDDFYCRNIVMDGTAGFIAVAAPYKDHALRLEIHLPDQDAKPALIKERVENIFDLNAPVKAIDDHLRKDRLLSSLVARQPGIRVPGSFNPYELCIRAIVGQQISVKGATTLIGRIAAGYGGPLDTPNAFHLKYRFPGPEKLVDADFKGIGLTRARKVTIHQLSAAVLEGRVNFHPTITPAALQEALLHIKGIGKWTAQYILMRTVKHPDAMPFSDLGLLKAVGSDAKPGNEKHLRKMSIPWKPWRAYAAMHLWSSLNHPVHTNQAAP